MKKLSTLQGFWLLYFANGGLSIDPFMSSALLSELDNEAIEDLKKLGYLVFDPEKECFVISKEGTDRAHFMLRAGINYDQHFKEATLDSKRAMFLSLVNSGYEPRGLFLIFVTNLSDIGFSQLKKAVFHRLRSKKKKSTR